MKNKDLNSILQYCIIILLILVLNQLSVVQRIPMPDESEVDTMTFLEKEASPPNVQQSSLTFGGDSNNRCTPGGEVCQYNNICYNTKSDQWETTRTNDQIIEGSSPLLNNIGMNNKHNISQDHELYSVSQCNERFQTIYSPNGGRPNNDKILSVQGTTYYVCGWVDHFGHALMNMALPSFHALSKIGFKNDLDKVKFLLESRAKGKINFATSIFGFFAGKNEKVLSLSELQSEARENIKSHICFDNLIVGMYHDSLIGVGIGDQGGVEQVDVGMLEPMKDHLKSLYPATRENINAALQQTLISTPTIPNNPPDCTITLLERRNNKRGIINNSEAIKVIQEVFHPVHWNFQRVAFEPDSSTMLSQYMTMQSTMLLISISGTGSHMSMFMPDGGVDLEVKFMSKVHNNEILCGVVPNLYCLTTDAVNVYGQNKTLTMQSNVMIDLDDFRSALQKARDQLWTRCRIATSIIEEE